MPPTIITVNQGESLTTDSRIWGGLNFKVGLLDQVDLQTIVPMHVDQRTQSSAVGQSQRKRVRGLDHSPQDQSLGQ